MMYGSMMSAMGFAAILWWLFWIALLGIIVYTVYRLVSNRHYGNERHSLQNDPIQILKERYARGEIDEETFMRMKDKLQ